MPRPLAAWLPQRPGKAGRKRRPRRLPPGPKEAASDILPESRLFPASCWWRGWNRQCERKRARFRLLVSRFWFLVASHQTARPFIGGESEPHLKDAIIKYHG